LQHENNELEGLNLDSLHQNKKFKAKRRLPIHSRTGPNLFLMPSPTKRRTKRTIDKFESNNV